MYNYYTLYFSVDTLMYCTSWKERVSHVALFPCVVHFINFIFAYPFPRLCHAVVNCETHWLLNGTPHHQMRHKSEIQKLRF